jgi:hypothetical protein
MNRRSTIVPVVEKMMVSMQVQQLIFLFFSKKDKYCQFLNNPEPFPIDYLLNTSLGSLSRGDAVVG